MQQPKITFIINKIPYSLNVSDVEAIRDMPSADRQQLIALLESIKREETSAHSTVLPVAASASTAAYPGNTPAHPNERLNSGDVDAMMAQLIMEENLNQKSGLTKQSIQKWTAVVAVVVFLLVLIM